MCTFSPTLALLLKDSTLAEEDAGLFLPEQEASGMQHWERRGSLRCYLELEYLDFLTGKQLDPEGGCWVICSNQSGTRSPSQAFPSSIPVHWREEECSGGLGMSKVRPGGKTLLSSLLNPGNLCEVQGVGGRFLQF